MAPHTSCLLSRSSNCHSQHFCDVCKYMFRMDWGNGHNNWCSNQVFNVYAYCHHCSTVHKVPDILGSTMLCLSNSSLSNTSHHSLLIIILWQSTMRAPYLKVTNIYMTTMRVQLATLLTMTAIVCVIPVTAMCPPLFSMVVVKMKIQKSSFKIGRASCRERVWHSV